MVGLDTILKILEIFKQYPDIDRFFMFDNLGYNIRISEPQAALGLEQLKKLKSFIKTRREIASLFTKFFYEYDDYISFIKPKKVHTHLGSGSQLF